MPWICSDPCGNLRSEPGEGPLLCKDPLLETQIAQGEVLMPKAWEGDWVEVEAPLQPVWKGKWEPYRGWLPRKTLLQTEAPIWGVAPTNLPVWKEPSREEPVESTVRLGSQLVGEMIETEGEKWCRLAWGGYTPLAEHKKSSWECHAIRWAREWISTPYLWGGTLAAKPEDPSRAWGIDCSGLIWRLACSYGEIFPRNAHDQWLSCYPLSTASDLLEGDLIFFSNRDPLSRIHHVLLVAEEGRVIEAVGERGFVVEEMLAQRCHIQPSTCNGSWTGEYRVWFGRPVWHRPTPLR
jgi:cell wall-associated NlpC family hydrolase